MRVWDFELLNSHSNVVQHDTVTVDANYTTSQEIYDAFITQYMSLGNYLMLCAIVENNTTNPRDVTSVYAFKGRASNGAQVNEVSRISSIARNTEANLKQGSVLQIYYIVWNDISEIRKMGVNHVSVVNSYTSQAYTLSSNIFNDFVTIHSPQVYQHVVIVVPDQDVAQSNYLIEMNSVYIGAQNSKFLRYPNTVYGVGSNYAARLQSGALVHTYIIDFKGWEENIR